MISVALALIIQVVYGQTLNMHVTYSQNSGPISTCYSATNTGYKTDFSKDESRASELDERLAQAGRPHIFIPSQELLTLQNDAERFESVAARQRETRERIRTMDRFEERRELFNLSTRSLVASREYYLSDDLESGSISLQIAEIFLDLSTSLTPGVSWVRDLWEAISGKDAITKEPLNGFSRTIAVVGAATFGFGSKAVKAVGVFEKLTKTMDSFSPARKLLYQKPISELKETIGFIKTNRIYKHIDTDAIDVTNAFMPRAKTRVVGDDLTVFRYYLPGLTDPKSHWVSPVKLANPEMELALRFPGKYEVHKWTIPKGTQILEGIAAPNFGKPGGAHQILINKDLLQ